MKNMGYTQHMKLIWQFSKFTFFLLKERPDSKYVTGHVKYKIIGQDSKGDSFLKYIIRGANLFIS